MLGGGGGMEVYPEMCNTILIFVLFVMILGDYEWIKIFRSHLNNFIASVNEIYKSNEENALV
jgi:hypothetical protein